MMNKIFFNFDFASKQNENQINEIYKYFKKNINDFIYHDRKIYISYIIVTNCSKPPNFGNYFILEQEIIIKQSDSINLKQDLEEIYNNDNFYAFKLFPIKFQETIRPTNKDSYVNNYLHYDLFPIIYETFKNITTYG